MQMNAEYQLVIILKNRKKKKDNFKTYSMSQITWLEAS